jgi:predicted RND superfamily exporter protein
LEWNFLNIAATPLLLGTGLDYLIHILLSLRRHRGDRRRVWHGTGKAVVFCGASTAIGFGSLAFASIDALASLGLVAVTGILITTVVAVVLVPALRTYPETR